MDCGKTERIEITKDRKIHADWFYYGKININARKTDKHMYRMKEGKTLVDKNAFVRVPNECYDPKAKRKIVELWSCGECVRAI
jgi:hypothetical protein